MKEALDWIVAYAIAVLGGVVILRAYLGLGTYVYVLPTIVMTLAGIIRLTKYKQRVPRLISFYVAAWCIFIVWLIISSLWRIRGIDSQQEYILLFGMLTVGLAALVSLSPGVLRKIPTALYVVGAGVAVMVFVRYARAGSLRGYGDVLSQYLVVARVLGLGTVAASLQLLTARQRPAYLWILAILLLGALAMSLARGALLSTLGIILLTGVFLSTQMVTRRETIWAWLGSRLKKVSLSFGVFALIGFAIFLAFQVERTAHRLRRMFSGNELQAGGRGELWTTSIENITAAPVFGYGLGSSGVMAGAHEGHYPHNLFLQVWLDGGVIAYLLLLGLASFPFLLALWYLINGRFRSNKWVPHLGLFLFLILEYSKSIDFYAGRLLLVLSIVAVWAIYLASRGWLASKTG